MIPTNLPLYESIKKDANKKFVAPTSAYRSAWIVRQYKERGGKFEGKKNGEQGLGRWFKEKWVDLNRAGKPCGRLKADNAGMYPLCRPTIVVNKQTPTLAQELSKQVIALVNKEKQKIKHNGHIKFKPAAR